MNDYPVVHVPPCDELMIVVTDLYHRYAQGTLTTLPASWRKDLNTLQSLCKNISPKIAEQLAVLLRLPDESAGGT